MRPRGACAAAIAALVAACGLAEPEGQAPEPAHPDGLACRPVPVPPGPEDLVVDHRGGRAFVVSTDRRAIHAGAVAGRVGFVTTLDLRVSSPLAIDVTPDSLRHSGFRPHGLGLLPGEPPTLFVVDRRAAPPSAGSCAVDNAVRIVAVDDGGLRLTKTVEDPERLIRLNDVEPLDAERFFVTNDHGAGSCLERNLRDLFGRNRGHLLVFDGERFRIAADGLPFANGLALDRRRRMLHVAASGDGTIHRFELGRDGSTDVAAHGRTALDRSPDNLSVGSDGTLLAVAHPDRLRFLFYQRQWFGTETSPSSILEMPPDGEVREVFADDGRTVSAASVAARYVWEEGGLERMLIGQVYGDRILLCDRPLAKKRAAPEGSGAASQVIGSKETRGRAEPSRRLRDAPPPGAGLNPRGRVGARKPEGGTPGFATRSMHAGSSWGPSVRDPAVRPATLIPTSAISAITSSRFIVRTPGRPRRRSR